MKHPLNFYSCFYSGNNFESSKKKKKNYKNRSIFTSGLSSVFWTPQSFWMQGKLHYNWQRAEEGKDDRRISSGWIMKDAQSCTCIWHSPEWVIKIKHHICNSLNPLLSHCPRGPSAISKVAASSISVLHNPLIYK